MTVGDGTIACVGGLAYDDAGRLLLVRRRNDPGRGLWSVPGGRVEAGESDAEALVREMAEETGLVVVPGRLVGRVLRGHYAIADYRCAVVGGTVRAGDDATDARWCDLADLTGLPLVDDLVETLAAWRALPPRVRPRAGDAPAGEVRRGARAGPAAPRRARRRRTSSGS